MDIKWKGKPPLALWFLVLLSLLITVLFPLFYRSVPGNSSRLYDKESFANELAHGGMVLYWETLQAESGEIPSPTTVFFPAVAARIAELEGKPPSDEGDALRSFSDRVYQQITARRNQFHTDWDNLEYLVLRGDKPVVNNGGEVLAAFAAASEPGTPIPASLSEQYEYIAIVCYNEQGEIAAGPILGADSSSLDRLAYTSAYSEMPDLLERYGVDESLWGFHKPQDMTVVFAVPRIVAAYTPLLADRDFYDASNFGGQWFEVLFTILVLGMAVFAWLPCRHNRPYASKAESIPLELAVVIGALPLYLWRQVAAFGIAVGRGQLLSRDQVVAVMGPRAVALAYLFGFLLLVAIGLGVYGAVASLHFLRREGLRKYLAKKTLIAKIFGYIGRLLNHFYRWLTEIDLSDRSNRAIIKILFVNFVILALLSGLWVFGIVGLVVYTIVLFFVLRRFSRELKEQYGRMLDVTGAMAQGQLDVEMGGDLGIFAPLGEELRKVQKGFRHAVDAEVKSEKLKTELITNVSHDLKTPLTAIITYANLLKNEDLPPEERQAYVHTLEYKSQRLKVLIEDLFDVSRASSGNIELHPARVDLCALIQQVEMELESEIMQSGIEFRHTFPPHPVWLMLDGEKTSRIFDNLIVNAVKHGLAGTRAYISIVEYEERVSVQIKNISREALDFGEADITERFVRGDSSRSTEGSGLGLAIARSFSEVQGGSLQIATDGDLFKCTVRFRRDLFATKEPPAEPLPETPPED